MGSGIAVQIAEKVGCSVGHQRLLPETRYGIDHAKQLGYLLHLIQVAYDDLNIGQTVQATLIPS